MQPEQLHVTLTFLGDIDPAIVPPIEAVLADVAAGHAAFDWRIHGVGVFPNRERPAVIWAGVEPADCFRKLAGSLSPRLQPLGYEPESRPFTPHLTLARVRGRVPHALPDWLDRYSATTFAAGRVSRIELMQSERTPAGQRYSVLAVAPLQKTASDTRQQSVRKPGR